MLYAGTFFGYTLSHIGDDIFINALVGGMADACANATSAILQKKYGLLPTYRTLSGVAFIAWTSLRLFFLQGFISYVFIAIACYCTGACLNYATATIVD